MIELLQQNTLLLLFTVVAIGYGIGRISVGNISLGISAVLFSGLAVGGLDPDLYVPEIIIFLGLSIFVYTIGLSSGPGFYHTFKHAARPQLLFLLMYFLISITIIIVIYHLFDFHSASLASIYAGSFTNTPALAALLDELTSEGSSLTLEDLQRKAVVGFSIAYPMGVLVVMFVLVLMKNLMNVNFADEEKRLRKKYPIHQNIINKAVRITNAETAGMEIREFKLQMPFELVMGRLVRDGKTFLTNYDTRFQLGDVVLVAADEQDMVTVIEKLGEENKNELPIDQSEYEGIQIFVSNPDVAGQNLAALNLHQKFSAIISRITRGDVDLLASGETALELGDRVRVIARRRDIDKIRNLFGDSYEDLSHVNLLSLGLGLTIGLLLGMINFNFGNDLSFSLGYAGGPLIVALVLGNLRRTGKIVWILPYSVNLTLQQIGLSLMLAGIGINSGHAFFDTLFTSEGLLILGAASLLIFITASTILFIGYVLLKIPYSILMGMTATQPAVLDFSIRQTGNKLPNIGFISMLPIKLVVILFIVQILYTVLG